ncbi:MAG: GDP-mannose 4,6-dehydratase [Planctomycetes bacterium]|nr:GDP-mannose 4,6-dehydratase [Planctomycetota bacterium]
MVVERATRKAAERRRCLITGGAGFIGSHLTDHLLALGHRVTVVDNLSTGRRDNLAPALAGPHAASLRVIEGDLSRVLRAELVAERFDHVYHLAAAVGVQRIVDRPIECIEANVIDTAELLRYAAEHGTAGGPARTLIASSSEVYGKSAKTPFSESDDCVYGPTTAWRWSYATSKAIDEYLALAWHAQRSLPVVITRFFNTVGPRQVGDYGMVLPRFVSAALRGVPLHVYGDGKQTRCFCDVRDIVPALVRLMDKPRALGLVVNLGSDTPVSIRELAERVLKTLRSGSPIEPIPYDRAYGPGFEDLHRRQPDLTRARDLIGFSPATPLEDTIRAIADTLRSPPPA